MSEFTVTRTLTDPRDKVWQVLTQPGHFEGWLPAKPGTAKLDVRTGGSWQATVISSEGNEIALTGRYDQVSEPDHLVMTVPGDLVTAITLTSPRTTARRSLTPSTSMSPCTPQSRKVSMPSSGGSPQSWLTSPEGSSRDRQRPGRHRRGQQMAPGIWR
jgi:uncharacterized protein YndB with AHSA1/START domain